MTDVLVVDGGPVGVSMGLLCAHRGLSVVIVERATEVYDLPRAIVMDDEIQRVFQGVGLMDRPAAVTTPLKGAEFLAADGTQIIGLEIPAHVRPNGHPLTVCYYQPELEALLRAAAVEAGARLLLGQTVEHVDDHEAAVTAELIGPAGEVTVLMPAGWWQPTVRRDTHGNALDFASTTSASTRTGW